MLNHICPNNQSVYSERTITFLIAVVFCHYIISKSSFNEAIDKNNLQFNILLLLLLLLVILLLQLLLLLLVVVQ